MREQVIDRKDAQIYKRVIRMADRQLGSIQHRLIATPGRLDIWFFTIRGHRIKRDILKILRMKDARDGKGALAEMMDDYRTIEAGWHGVEKDVLDYIRLIVHGLYDVREQAG